MRKKILLVEDNDDDVLIIERGLNRGKIDIAFNRVRNGKEALEYLRQDNMPYVQLILLDLNMEVMNGFEFLRERRKAPIINRIPVVVLTSSHRQQDVEMAYDLGANSYVVKPLIPTEFIDVILTIEDFWISLAVSA